MENYKVVAVNYADRPYRRSQKLNTKTAYGNGRVDAVYEYSRKDISPEFIKKNKEIFCAKRGGGYWLWKPYVVKKTFEKIEEGDYLAYVDAGGFFYTGNVRTVVEEMRKQDQWLLVQEQPFLEKYYTKRDVFIIMNCDFPSYTDSNQCMGGLFIIKKCGIAEQFLDEWLQYAQNINAITDNENVCGKDNYDGFVAHRNDQSIFSVLRKKYGIVGFDSITQEGKYKIVYYHHTRCGHIWEIKLHDWFMKKKGLVFNEKAQNDWIVLKKRIKAIMLGRRKRK